MTDLTIYFQKQKELDEYIHSNHQESYQSTLRKRILALLVELGEFANETRCFKFWSLKGPSKKEVILDEYADGLHFFFSIGVALNYQDYKINETPSLELNEQIILVYDLVTSLANNYSKENYQKAFDAYWAILNSLSFSISEALEAYDKKLSINYQRQENHY